MSKTKRLFRNKKQSGQRAQQTTPPAATTVTTGPAEFSIPPELNKPYDQLTSADIAAIRLRIAREANYQRAAAQGCYSVAPPAPDSPNRPVSAAQFAANRANALKSTGPKTLEGKAKVAMNALRHGLTAQQIIVRDDEREEFQAMERSEERRVGKSV